VCQSFGVTSYGVYECDMRTATNYNRFFVMGISDQNNPSPRVITACVNPDLSQCSYDELDLVDIPSAVSHSFDD
jgi:hypothetical protein